MKNHELVKNIAYTSGLRQEDVKAVINAMVEEIIEGLRHGDTVTVSGLGKFYTTRFKARTQTDPNGRIIHIPEHSTPKFKSSERLKREARNA